MFIIVGCMWPIFMAWRLLDDLESGLETCFFAALALGVGFVTMFAVLVPSGEHYYTSLQDCYHKHTALTERINPKSNISEPG
jgi:hypothetical protein